jgi:hypothetical protein
VGRKETQALVDGEHELARLGIVSDNKDRKDRYVDTRGNLAQEYDRQFEFVSAPQFRVVAADRAGPVGVTEQTALDLAIVVRPIGGADNRQRRHQVLWVPDALRGIDEPATLARSDREARQLGAGDEATVVSRPLGQLGHDPLSEDHLVCHADLVMSPMLAPHCHLSIGSMGVVPVLWPDRRGRDQFSTLVRGYADSGRSGSWSLLSGSVGTRT